MTQENMIFALDIGTHSVVGVLGTAEKDGFNVLDYEQHFHRRGAMRDGQIEDIHLVTDAVTLVKDALEQRNAVTLSRVSIAAAGRSLVTIPSTFEQDTADEPLTTEQIRSVEYGALSRAAESLPEKTVEDGFSCVGYSVTSYWVDNYRYRNPEGHQGHSLKVELIAAFLPGSVIRSLYAVTERCGLSVDSLTLEPIAAIEAVVPVDIRLLNLALVDIGAGTSDIAISKNGSIVAYDMATVAGDEITEALMQRFLVDFETAEMLKCALNKQSSTFDPDAPVSYTNILAFPQTCSRQDILSAAENAADTLCGAIAESIRRLNQEVPVAVFLVGGGSRFPTLCAKLADALDLPPDRVALGGTKEYKNLRLCSDSLLSPEFVTPLGILANSSSARLRDFFSISVNDQKVMLWEMGGLKVLDALLLAGIKASQLIGRSPAPLTFTLNGIKRTVRGTPSTPGSLLLNGTSATLDTPVHQGDQIQVTFASDGIPPHMQLSDLLKEFDGPCDCRINWRTTTPDQQILSGDEIHIVPKAEKKSERIYHICLNGSWLDVHADGETGLLPFVQLLNHVDIDTKNPQGDLVLTLNGQNASFTDLVTDNDSAEIRWSQEIPSSQI